MMKCACSAGLASLSASEVTFSAAAMPAMASLRRLGTETRRPPSRPELAGGLLVSL